MTAPPAPLTAATLDDNGSHSPSTWHSVDKCVPHGSTFAALVPQLPPGLPTAVLEHRAPAKHGLLISTCTRHGSLLAWQACDKADDWCHTRAPAGQRRRHSGGTRRTLSRTIHRAHSHRQVDGAQTDMEDRLAMTQTLALVNARVQRPATDAQAHVLGLQRPLAAAAAVGDTERECQETNSSALALLRLLTRAPPLALLPTPPPHLRHHFRHHFRHHYHATAQHCAAAGAIANLRRTAPRRESRCACDRQTLCSA